MFVAPSAAPIVGAALEMVDGAERQEDFPPLRAGVAGGPAITKEGDWYGTPVNLASRITAVSRPASVLATRDVRDAAPDQFSWSAVGERRLKGFRQPAQLYRARRPGSVI
jgi:adenylate cyclase